MQVDPQRKNIFSVDIYKKSLATTLADNAVDSGIFFL